MATRVLALAGAAPAFLGSGRPDRALAATVAAAALPARPRKPRRLRSASGGVGSVGATGAVSSWDCIRASFVLMILSSIHGVGRRSILRNHRPRFRPSLGPKSETYQCRCASHARPESLGWGPGQVQAADWRG